MSRDFVRFLPNQRVDLPDFDSVQRNARSDTRGTLAHLLFGSNAGTDTFVKRVFGGWAVVEDGGGPSSIVEVSNGSAVGFEILPDGTEDKSTVFGLDGPLQQNVDFTGKPPGTYTVWIRFVQDLGVLGARVFWNDNTQLEDVDSIETRLVVTWDVRAETSSPGAEWQRIADVVWDGVTIDNADITGRRKMFFEGLEESTYPHVWGDGANDRNADRAAHGVKDLFTFVHAMRRQLEEIVDNTGTYKWYELPVFSIEAHRADNTDPHTSTLIQTILSVLSDFEVQDGAFAQFHANVDEISMGAAADIFIGQTGAPGASQVGVKATGDPNTGGWVMGSMDGFNWESTTGQISMGAVGGTPGTIMQFFNDVGPINITADGQAKIRSADTAIDAIFLESASGGINVFAAGGRLNLVSDADDFQLNASLASQIRVFDEDLLIDVVLDDLTLQAGLDIRYVADDFHRFYSASIAAGNELLSMHVDEILLGKGNTGLITIETPGELKLHSEEWRLAHEGTSWSNHIATAPTSPAQAEVGIFYLDKAGGNLPLVLSTMTGNALAGWIDADEIESNNVTVANYYFTPSSSPLGVNADVPLQAFGVPNGAVLNSITVFGRSAGSADAVLDIALRRISQGVHPQTNTTLASGSDTGGASPENLTVSLTFFSPSNEIDYDTFEYFLRVETLNDSAGADCRVYDAQVEWGMPAIIPKISGQFDI